MAEILSASAPTRFELVVVLSAPIEQEEASQPARWRLVSSQGRAVHVGAVLIATGGLSARLVVTSPMSGGQAYTVSAAGALDSAGDPVTGSASATAPGGDLAGKARVGLLEALTDQLGRALARLGGAPTAQLACDFAPGDDRLVLHSTLGLPAQGALWCGGRRLRYSALDPSMSAALSVVDERPDGLAIAGGTLAHLDVGAVPARAQEGGGGWLGQVWEAWRDTLVWSASGAALRELGALYGVPWLRAFSERAFRDALGVVAFGARGTLGNTVAFLEALYGELGVSSTVELTPEAPRRLMRVGEPWEVSHEGRLVRVAWTGADGVARSRLFWSARRVDDDEGLELAPVATSYFDGANFAVGAGRITEKIEATATVLPFVLMERDVDLRAAGLPRGLPAGLPCLVEVLLDGEALYTPASYLLDPAGRDRDDIPPGSILLDLFNLFGASPAPPSEGDHISGPHPLYLHGGGSRITVSALLDRLLAAGVGAAARVHNFGG